MSAPCAVQIGTSGGDSEAHLTSHVTPTVDAERCVHGRSPIAQCRSCVVACPGSAFALEDDGLTFDEDLCDGCALCAAACPEQAIDAGSVSPLVSPPVGADRAFLACEKVVACGEPGMVACWHAVSAAELARLHASGIRLLVAAQADCMSCSRNCGTTLSDRLSHMACLTRDRGLPPLTLRQVGHAAWRDERDDAGRVTRRSLFRAALGGHRNPTVDGGAPDAAPNGVTAPDLLLGARDRATIASFSPSIDRAACVACGVCVEVCEHGAVRLSASGDRGGARYDVDGTRCTGCAVCVDSCEAGAISLAALGVARPPPVSLVKGKCQRCSSPFYAVAQTAVDTSLCRICATKSHHQKLFQVLP
jgi:Pyruvate/2-oxoacid:ferredoxin oxidoreductase delta subunit